MSFLSLGWLWLFLPLGLYLFHSHVNNRLLLNRKNIPMMIAMIFIIIAMSRPALEKEPVSIAQEGNDIIIAIDLSYSMYADDLKPTRLEYAKQLLHDLIASDHKDRFGIIGFTTNAIILSPLSDDSELLLHLFSGLDETLVMTKGTAIMPLLKLARKMSKSKDPTLLVLSDGGDAEHYKKEAAFAKAQGLHVNILMLASERGATIEKSDGSLLNDSDGNIVVTSENRAIKALSDASDGEYLSQPDLHDVRNLLAKKQTHDFESEKKVMEYREFFYLFIFLAIASALLAFTTLSLYPKGTSSFLTAYARRALIALLLVFGISLDADDNKLHYNHANMLYNDGHYDKALSLYKSVKSSDPLFKSQVYFNMGNCLIRLQEYDKARVMFVKSLTLVDDIEARENLLALFYAQEQDHLITGRQKGKKRVQESSAENSKSDKKKQGGGSNMDVSADASGGGDEGKKVKSDPRLSFSKSKNRLSSKQYELINQRSVHESKPW
ncbi:MAG: VWA domain-containing protein [Campylobacterota bacterium]|nr:VWA domain-containing protein [Campylobacterota bacterium]